MEIFKKIRYKYLDIKNGITQVLKWLPTIYKDRDWDHTYFYIIISKKLELMIKTFENSYGKNYEYVGIEKDIEQMRLCKSTLDRIIEEEHVTYARRIEYDNLGVDISLYTDEELFKDSANFLNDTNLKEIYFGKEELVCDKIFEDYTNEQYRELFCKITELSEKMYQEDLEIFTNILKTQSERWWI